MRRYRVGLLLTLVPWISIARMMPGKHLQKSDSEENAEFEWLKGAILPDGRFALADSRVQPLGRCIGQDEYEMLMVQQTLATKISMNLLYVECTKVQFAGLHWLKTKTRWLEYS